MTIEQKIFVKCALIENSNFLHILYKDKSNMDQYGNRLESKYLGKSICHYCTSDVLKDILENGCLRFSDVRFLNDKTEFLEIIRIIKCVIKNEEYNYDSDFKDFILNSGALDELNDYEQSYIVHSEKTNSYEKMSYRVYTCSFSTENNSLGMWNYYAASAGGINVCFDFPEHMFVGGDFNKKVRRNLDNNIIMDHALVSYETKDKEKCIIELLNKTKEIYNDAKCDYEKYKNWILNSFKAAINNMRCFFKNRDFDYENEYRIALRIPKALIQSKDYYGDIKSKGFFKRGNVLIPYVDYKFQKESISQVTLNPYIEKDSLFELGIRELLWQNQLEKVRVVRSCIPLRKYV